MDNEEKIKTILRERFSPVRMEIVNDSHRHAGHAGDNGTGQTHFEVVVVSAVFHGISRVDSHRMIYEALDPVFATGLHALKIRALAPAEEKIS